MLRRRDQFTLDLMEKVPQGAGSGTIWDTDGHVVTNAHVIAGASDLQARPSCHPIHMSSSRGNLYISHRTRWLRSTDAVCAWACCESGSQCEAWVLCIADHLSSMAQVSLMGDEEYPASIVGVDRDKDVAVLQLKMPEDIDKKVRRMIHPASASRPAAIPPITQSAGALKCQMQSVAWWTHG